MEALIVKNVLVTLPLEADQKTRLEQQLPNAGYTYSPAGDVTDGQITAADIILGNLPPERVPLATHLEWMQLNSSGADAYAAPGVLAPGARLTNSTGAYGLAISEHLLAQTFFLKKKLGLYHRNQLNKRWQDEGRVTAIQDSTTLVVGLGSIGGDYARKMSLLGSKVYGIRRNKTAAPDYLQAVGTFDDLDAWLPLADIVAVALPNTPQTFHLFDARRLSMMKPGSILLNVGRGTSVDTDALCQALLSGPLMAAAVDVTDPEPLPVSHPLWDCENLLLTPHISGDYHLQETLDYIVALFIRNLGHYASGEPLENPVDPKTGYRKFAQ